MYPWEQQLNLKKVQVLIWPKTIKRCSIVAHINFTEKQKCFLKSLVPFVHKPGPPQSNDGTSSPALLMHCSKSLYCCLKCLACENKTASVDFSSRLAGGLGSPCTRLILCQTGSRWFFRTLKMWWAFRRAQVPAWRENTGLLWDL